VNYRILRGDVRDRLRDLPDSSVRTCVTSPPYWGLRDYGVPGQLGLEATPDEFVVNLVAVFREVRRVLADDGTLWMNLGDSYLAQQGLGFNGNKRLDLANRSIKVKRPVGVKPKDLVGIPWMVAFALRADGWYLRSDIIWSKPNPMPESIKDRPTKAHEYIFLLSKSSRYYYDADAIAEAASEAMLSQMEQGYNGLGLKDYEGAGVQNPSSVKARSKVQQQKGWNNDRNDGGVSDIAPRGFGRNKRTVWHVATQPYPEAHFATYPEKLIEPCILAGSQIGDTVLDPFNGSGTTGVVAIRHQRNYVGVELNPEYIALAERRIASVAPLFSTMGEPEREREDPYVRSSHADGNAKNRSRW
jgi:DNA modification methylase